ncbi:unnamed protein product [Rodentolepis nana]|uniref:Lig_chan-Glu_bd domain-containing protein n=1 Tax=Rodentolepis nana TaxID=102285 RepID=A0A0R3TYN2_RODNA|nr:unnamed protein product [Rodentolepis nana]
MMEKKDAYGNEIKGEYEGFCVDLVEKLSQMIKFKYKMKAVSDGQFGIIVNGSWNGMIGELLRRVTYRESYPINSPNYVALSN